MHVPEDGSHAPMNFVVNVEQTLFSEAPGDNVQNLGEIAEILAPEMRMILLDK